MFSSLAQTILFHLFSFSFWFCLDAGINLVTISAFFPETVKGKNMVWYVTHKFSASFLRLSSLFLLSVPFGLRKETTFSQHKQTSDAIRLSHTHYFFSSLYMSSSIIGFQQVYKIGVPRCILSWWRSCRHPVKYNKLHISLLRANLYRVLRVRR